MNDLILISCKVCINLQHARAFKKHVFATDTRHSFSILIVASFLQFSCSKYRFTCRSLYMTFQVAFRLHNHYALHFSYHQCLVSAIPTLYVPNHPCVAYRANRFQWLIEFMVNSYFAAVEPHSSVAQRSSQRCEVLREFRETQ